MLLVLGVVHAQFSTSYTSTATRRKAGQRLLSLCSDKKVLSAECMGLSCPSLCDNSCLGWTLSTDADWAMGPTNTVPYTADLAARQAAGVGLDRSQWLEGNTFVMDGAGRPCFVPFF